LYSNIIWSKLRLKCRMITSNLINCSHIQWSCLFCLAVLSSQIDQLKHHLNSPFGLVFHYYHPRLIDVCNISSWLIRTWTLVLIRFFLSPTCTTVARLLSYDCFAQKFFVASLCSDSYVTFSIPNTWLILALFSSPICVTVPWFKSPSCCTIEVFFFQFVLR
jgi:hypothetical protein